MSGHQRQDKKKKKQVPAKIILSTFSDELHYETLCFNVKDTEKKDDVRLGHKLSLTAAVDITLWGTRRH